MNGIRFALQFSLLFLLMSLSCSVWAQSGKDSPISVCSLFSHSRISEGKQVFVDGSLTATMEAMWLADASCPKRLYLRYDTGKDDALGKVWQDAVNDQIGGIDRRPMHVVVQGVFRGRIQSGNRHIAQLTVTKIIAWDRKTSATSEVPQ